MRYVTYFIVNIVTIIVAFFMISIFGDNIFKVFFSLLGASLITPLLGLYLQEYFYDKGF